MLASLNCERYISIFGLFTVGHPLMAFLSFCRCVFQCEASVGIVSESLPLPSGYISASGIGLRRQKSAAKEADAKDTRANLSVEAQDLSS